MYLFITAEILDGSKKPEITAISIKFQHKYYKKTVAIIQQRFPYPFNLLSIYITVPLGTTAPFFTTTIPSFTTYMP